MVTTSRRQFLQAGLGLAATSGLALPTLAAQEAGDRPKQADSVRVLNPKTRVPLSFIIDDSTCLVNLAHFCIPQFAEVFPDQYKQPWQELPREIPDSFVRSFGEWCHEHGVKGKYSIVPYPACVGWIDREMPGWSRKQLEDSLELVRTLMMPDWDIHPEMITHTWAINTRTGRPYEERSERFMENWGFSVGKSVDELTDYFSYALRLLKNAGLPCEGVTTPGGFGTRVLPEISQATFESVRDVFGAEIPHYFRHLYTDDRSVAPRIEYASGLDGDDPRCVVSIIGCTGDWFGGWDGLTPGSVDQFITEDLKGGRLPEVIDRGEPAILVCHWPGIYYNGDELGFTIFKEIVARLNAAYDNLIWMKNSEIARYWAARELTTLVADADHVSFRAPYACPGFTVEVDGPRSGRPTLQYADGTSIPLREVRGPLQLDSGTWCRSDSGVILCFDLTKGASSLSWKADA
ncbi:twin-arginine translocation signal domain-containing protein [Tautonia marina]|uniref:twin-arginine translocation signal domain-containing protein n=1 Tax=Tautonia marina TaxID=2653855 RepID=UPI00191C19C1|nr:twin-arginine translocation signal domain-containing protein [Tautonia marina]